MAKGEPVFISKKGTVKNVPFNMAYLQKKRTLPAYVLYKICTPPPPPLSLSLSSPV